MNSGEFLEILEAKGFVVKRRSRDFVWLSRAPRELLVSIARSIDEPTVRLLLEEINANDLRAATPTSSGTPEDS